MTQQGAAIMEAFKRPEVVQRALDVLDWLSEVVEDGRLDGGDRECAAELLAKINPSLPAGRVEA